MDGPRSLKMKKDSSGMAIPMTKVVELAEKLGISDPLVVKIPEKW
jgi:hypothetical protein